MATRMGGAGAPDTLDEAHRTQVWLAISDDPAALVSSRYFYHMQLRQPNRIAEREDAQEAFCEACERLSGVALPV